LLFDYRKLQGDEDDRSIRTSLAVNEDSREAAMVDPDSRESQMARERFRVALSALPAEVVESLQLDNIDRMSARDIDIVEAELSRNQSARLHGGGGGRGSVEGMRSAARADGRENVEGIDVVPENFVNMLRGRFENPEHARYYAQLSWSNMTQEDRDAYLRNPEMDRWRTIRIPGFEQVDPGSQISPDQLNEVMRDAATLSTLSTLSARAEEANATIENMSTSERLRLMSSTMAQVQNHPAALQFEDVRQQMIGTLNQLQGGGVLNDSERVNWDNQLPRITSVANLFSGNAMASLRVAFARARTDLINRIRSRGFAIDEGEGPDASRRTDSAPAQRQAPAIRGTRIRFRDRDGNVRRTRPVTDEAAARRIIESAGGTVL
jgi:hypothetical protein